MNLHTILQGEDWVGDPPSQVPRPLRHKWDVATEQWLPVEDLGWDGSRWARADRGDTTLAQLSPFDPYIGEGTVWQRDVSAMPLATDSAAFAAWMAANINYGGGFGATSLNTSQAGTHPIQCYVVDSRMPGCNFQYITGNFVAGFATTVLSGWVPWPKDMFIPQAGQDSGLAILDLATGYFREYYFVAKSANRTNRWTCSTGGYSVAPRDLVGWAEQNYATQLTEGSHAVVRMHNHLGFIDIAGSRRGVIDHAIAYTCSNMNVPTSSGEAIMLDGTRYTSVGASWPALAGDGDSVGANIPIHGQWARLPMSLDLSATGPYPPFLRMVIQAIQTYGCVATDSNNFVHAFNTESGYAEYFNLGVDPWSSLGDVYQKFAKQCIDEGRPAANPFDMALFPWGELEFAPRNWGKPE